MPTASDVPNPQLPVAQRLRIRYAKRGRLRFTSHRDFGRAFERAVRRAQLPVAYSSGYSPHPRLSYAGAAPTGASSSAEYLEIALTRQCDPEQVRGVLDAALPDGFDVLSVVTAAGGALADRLQASEWRLTLPGVTVDSASRAVAALLSAERVEVTRMTKKGLRTFDCRSAVVRLTVEPDSGSAPGDHGSCAILRVVLRHGTPSVRPDDVLAGLEKVAGLASPVPPLLDRVAQGPLDATTGTVGDPFRPDRDTPQENAS